MELHVIDNEVTINTPGMRDVKRIFPDVLAALDWVQMELSTQTQPAKCSVTISNVASLFPTDQDQQNTFKAVYGSLSSPGGCRFTVTGKVENLVTMALQVWLKFLPRDARRRVIENQKKIETALTEHPNLKSIVFVPEQKKASKRRRGR